MDLVTGQRTYVLGVSGQLSQHLPKVVDVPFKDTAGNIIQCNYCSIQLGPADGATESTTVVLELSGLSREGDMVTNELSAIQKDTSLAGSGILGIAVCNGYLGGTPIAEWHGSNGEVATGAKLQLMGNDAQYKAVLTYGNLYPLNTLRLEQSYDKGV